MLKLLKFMGLAIGLVLVAIASLFGPYSPLLVLRRGLFWEWRRCSSTK
jgi:hypothetical protein